MNVPVTVPFLDLRQQHIPLKAELLSIVSEAIDQARFIGGTQVELFEQEFASFCSTKWAIGVSNGTDALRFALQALGVQPGQYVVTVPNTFIATTEAISLVGGKIEFVDVNPQTCLMDPQCLQTLLKKRFDHGPRNQRPVAIIPVHLYGQCCDMDAIRELAQRYELKILEDAAQAHGATYRGQIAGSMGDAAAFSFYPGKNLGACGEAGAVTTNNSDVADTIRCLRDHGQREKYYHRLEGTNGRLDAIQAAVLRLKLKHLPVWNAQRKEHASHYDVGLAKMNWVRPVQVRPENNSAHHLYVIHTSHRDLLKTKLREVGIETALHYPLPLHLQQCYSKQGWSKGDFPNAEFSSSNLLSLPMYAELRSDQVKQVVYAMEHFGQLYNAPSEKSEVLKKSA